MDRFVIISGCSSGGKSTLIQELKRRGYDAVEEPGRRVIAYELANLGEALPWVNLAAFVERALQVSLDDRNKAKDRSGLVFFGRSVIDAAAAMEKLSGEPVLSAHAAIRYNRRVFITPPWPEIYVNDDDRRHSLEDAIAEYHRLLIAFSSLNYVVELLPKVDVAKRADFVLDCLDLRNI